MNCRVVFWVDLGTIICEEYLNIKDSEKRSFSSAYRHSIHASGTIDSEQNRSAVNVVYCVVFVARRSTQFLVFAEIWQDESLRLLLTNNKRVCYYIGREDVLCFYFPQLDKILILYN